MKWSTKSYKNILQIHLAENGDISIYSRNQENNTSKYPDIIGRFDNTRGEGVKTCILDCEAVAWDNEKKQILPFQILSTRKRKVMQNLQTIPELFRYYRINAEGCLYYRTQMRQTLKCRCAYLCSIYCI